MGKNAVSVTLGEDNLVWLKGCAMKAGGSLSAILDELISHARSGPSARAIGARTVVGTIDLAVDDPALERADDALAGLFRESFMRPSVAREAPVTYGVMPKTRKSRKVRRG